MKLRKQISLFTVAIALGASLPACALELVGRVIGVADGDTLTVLANNEPIHVRLANIDAPEKAQAFGKVSKKALSDLCYGKEAHVTVYELDKYKRSVGTVFCNGINSNAEQVKTGMAWVYDKYVRDQSFYALQKTAKENKLGLWVDPRPIEPWLWRKTSKLEPTSLLND